MIKIGTWWSMYAAEFEENRISVTGFIIYLLWVPNCWRSKGQRGLAMSSSEENYVAMLDTVKETLYLLRYMRIPVEFPIMVKTDSISAIFLE
jgi:hypothetical protein